MSHPERSLNAEKIGEGHPGNEASEYWSDASSGSC